MTDARNTHGLHMLALTVAVGACCMRCSHAIEFSAIQSGCVNPLGDEYGPRARQGARTNGIAITATAAEFYSSFAGLHSPGIPKRRVHAHLISPFCCTPLKALASDIVKPHI